MAPSHHPHRRVPNRAGDGVTGVVGTTWRWTCDHCGTTSWATYPDQAAARADRLTHQRSCINKETAAS